MRAEGVSREEFNELQELLVQVTGELSGLTAAYARLEERYRELEERHQQLVADISTRLSAVQIGPVQASVEATSPSASTAALAGLTLAPHRISACESIGAWIRRCLADQVRGKSGRERIELPSKVYLVIRDKDNNLCDPPRVFNCWADTRHWVYLRGSPPSCAIYIGLPSKTEARICCRAAGLGIPAALQ